MFFFFSTGEVRTISFLFKRHRTSGGYEKNVTFTDNASWPIKVEYFTNCGDEKSFKNKTNVCEDLKVLDKVEFSIRLSIESCPSDPQQQKKTVTIHDKESKGEVRVDVEMLCSCVSWPGGVDPDEKVKEVTPFEYGTLDEYCRANASDSLLCSGRGYCHRGHCICDHHEDGFEPGSPEFCECANSTCPKDSEGRVCGGESRGTCECGSCACKRELGYTGEDCDCYQGYSGCLNGGDCFMFESCVACWYLGKGELADTSECDKRCNRPDADAFDAERVSKLIVDNHHRLCNLYLDGECSYHFTYTYTDNFRPQLVHIIEGSDCFQEESNSVNWGGVAVAVPLGAVALALLYFLVSDLVRCRRRLRQTRERNAAAMPMM